MRIAWNGRMGNPVAPRWRVDTQMAAAAGDQEKSRPRGRAEPFEEQDRTMQNAVPDGLVGRIPVEGTTSI
jgi:hypothetical protein